MTYLKAKLQRNINAQTDLRLVFHLKNIRVNQHTVGCSGFVENTDNNKVVYVSTEKSTYGPLANQNIYRHAQHTSDYTGGHNLSASDRELPSAIISQLS